MSTNDTTRYGGFDELMKRHQRLIRSLCWWYAGGNTDKTSDLIQDVLLKLWHYRWFSVYHCVNKEQKKAVIDALMTQIDEHREDAPLARKEEQAT